ncbi:MAG TPA: hypothetical protein VNN74_04555 [Candidatus Micrarchaeia archaeon]|nr:hypothetical protein [Candidatus Micrarchaeia archaeon]
MAVWLTHGAWQSPTSTLACGNGDCLPSAWFLGWVAFAVTHLRDPFTTTYLSPPGHTLGLMWNDAAPLLGLVLAPVTVSAGAVVAYNAGITAGLALSAWTASLAISRLTRHLGSAWVGGLVFGFSPWMVGEARAGHLFLVNLWLVPLFFLLLVDVLGGDERVGPRAGVLLGVVAAAQLLISQEILADAVLLGLLVTIGIAVDRRRALRDRLRRAVPRVMAAVVTFTMVAALPLSVALWGPGHNLRGRVESPLSNVADLLGLVVPRVSELIAPFGSAVLSRRWGSEFEGALYAGIPLLMIVGLAWWRHRAEPWVRGALLLFAVAAVLTLGPVLHVDGTSIGLPLPWIMLLHVPVYGLLVPVRMAPFAYLGAAVCLALVLDRHWPDRSDARLAWPGLVAVAAVLPLVPAGPLPRWVFPSPQYFATGGARDIPAGSLIAIASPYMDAMLWQAEAGFRFRMPWGYAIQPGSSGRAAGGGPVGVLEASWLQAASGIPVGFGPHRAALIRAELHGWHARAVVVGPMPHREAVVAVTTAALGRPPRWTEGVAVWTLAPETVGGRASVDGWRGPARPGAARTAPRSRLPRSPDPGAGRTRGTAAGGPRDGDGAGRKRVWNDAIVTR